MNPQVDETFLKKFFDLHLNTKFIPLSYHLFIAGYHPYLGYFPSHEIFPKAAIFDFDGVFEFPESMPLYLLFPNKLAEENQKVRRKLPELEKSFEEMDKTGNVILVEEKTSKIYKECDISPSNIKAATDGVVKEFKFAKRSREFISRIKTEMGYLPGIISGAPQLSLESLGEMLGIDRENIYGTEFHFDEKGKFKKISLRLRFRKLDAKTTFLQKFVNNPHGCYFVFSDDPKLDEPLAKAGLNPSIFIGKFEKKELPFDVCTTCPEARENMLNLIPKMYQFEMAYVASFYRGRKEEEKILSLRDEILDLYERSLEKIIEFNRVKDNFAKKSIEFLNFYKPPIAKAPQMTRLIFKLSAINNIKESKKHMTGLLTYFKKYVPEFAREDFSLCS